MEEEEKEFSGEQKEARRADDVRWRRRRRKRRRKGRRRRRREETVEEEIFCYSSGYSLAWLAVPSVPSACVFFWYHSRSNALRARCLLGLNYIERDGK